MRAFGDNQPGPLWHLDTRHSCLTGHNEVESGHEHAVLGRRLLHKQAGIKDAIPGVTRFVREVDLRSQDGPPPASAP